MFKPRNTNKPQAHVREMIRQARKSTPRVETPVLPQGQGGTGFSTPPTQVIQVKPNAIVALIVETEGVSSRFHPEGLWYGYTRFAEGMQWVRQEFPTVKSSTTAGVMMGRTTAMEAMQALAAVIRKEADDDCY